MKEKDKIINQKDELLNKCKLNVSKKYETIILELETEISDFKNSGSKEKEEQEMKIINKKKEIDDLKRKISEIRNQNNKLYFEKEKSLKAKSDLEKQLFNEKRKLDKENINRYDLILPINDPALQNELKFADIKKINMENKRRKKIIEISKILEKKLNYQNKKKEKDNKKIFELERHKSKIKYGKIANKNENFDENRIIEENKILDEKIFKIKEQKAKKENENQKNKIIVSSDKQINDLKNKVEKINIENKLEISNFCILNSSDDENGDKNDAPCVLDPRGGINNSKIDYSTPGESISELETEYSYSCINKEELTSCIEENTESTKIEIEIENNGTRDWPKNNVRLIFEQKSQIKGENIILKPQKCHEKNKYEIQFNHLNQYKEGTYESFVYININDWCGEQIKLKIIIKKKKIISEMEKHLHEIEEFRKQFFLNPDEYPNEKLFLILKKNDFDTGPSFAELFNN